METLKLPEGTPDVSGALKGVVEEVSKEIGYRENTDKNCYRDYPDY